jgi:hypothetical protein
MEFSIFIPLMVAAIQSAGQVLSSFASKAKEAASNYIFDKEFVENTIVDSTEQLADLLKATSYDLKQEIREQGIISVVQELQAHIASIGKLLSLVKTSEIKPAMAERLITGGLLPLQISLEKAELRLKHYGRDEMCLYCHIVGTSTLIAGYVYAGQDVPTLQKDLKDSIYIFQKHLLDSIAHAMIEANREIPWDKVPHLLTADNVSDLFELYNSTLQGVEKITPVESRSILSKEFDTKPKASSAVRKRKVSEMDLQDITGTARILHDFLYMNLSCSECGCKGFAQNTSICPNCKRKFV